MWKYEGKLPVKTMAQMQQIDSIAIRERGISSLWLMDNAARAVADLAKDRTEPGGEITILCGSGNNGGDGIAAARMLLAAGYRVNAVLCGQRERMTADSRSNAQRLTAAGGILRDLADTDLPGAVARSQCVIDALFGVGLKRPLEGVYADITELVNRCRGPVIACDIPSGLHGDTGEVLGSAVRAQDTVTFTCAKPGLLLPQAKPYVGRLHVADIGIPRELLQDERTK